MRILFLLSSLTAALFVSVHAHAFPIIYLPTIDCWQSVDGGQFCYALSDEDNYIEHLMPPSASGPPSTDERTIVCDDVARLFWDYCPVIEDTGELADADEDEAFLCEDAPLLVEEFCGSQ